MEEFSNILPKIWAKDTAYNQDWDISNPAKNQCVPTSLLARKIFDGEIAKYEIFLSEKRIGTHYSNIIEGRDFDFTKSQFVRNEKLVFIKVLSKTELKALESNTKERYEILAKNFVEFKKFS